MFGYKSLTELITVEALQLCDGTLEQNNVAYRQSTYREFDSQTSALLKQTEIKIVRINLDIRHRSIAQ